MHASLEQVYVAPAKSEKLASSHCGPERGEGDGAGDLPPHLRLFLRFRLFSRNPVSDCERPRVDQPELHVLSEVEIARLLTAYRELEAEAEEETKMMGTRTRGHHPRRTTRVPPVRGTLFCDLLA